MKNDELKVIKKAIIHEIEGYEFYKLASEKADSLDTKNAFIELADEELTHIEWLKKLFNNIDSDKSHKFDLAFIESPESANVYDWSNLDRRDAALAVSVFGIAIQMERTSIDFYENAAKNSSVEKAKELYLILANWEKAHLEHFSERYEELREAWWSKQNFAPY
ncbi:ferritin family protein [Clostridium sediminicola]|uniref:ferritin family protein n=1 Tax=Clostridium sediminicola TaxID=3114879 RepID=UPI0031F23406